MVILDFPSPPLLTCLAWLRTRAIARRSLRALPMVPLSMVVALVPLTSPLALLARSTTTEPGVSRPGEPDLIRTLRWTAPPPLAPIPPSPLSNRESLELALAWAAQTYPATTAPSLIFLSGPAPQEHSAAKAHPRQVVA